MQQLTLLQCSCIAESVCISIPSAFVSSLVLNRPRSTSTTETGQWQTPRWKKTASFVRSFHRRKVQTRRGYGPVQRSTIIHASRRSHVDKRLPERIRQRAMMMTAPIQQVMFDACTRRSHCKFLYFAVEEGMFNFACD